MKRLTKDEKLQRQRRFGAYLRDLREDRNLSVKEVAKGIGISGPYLYQVENGKKALANSRIYRKMNEFFAIPGEELLRKAGYLPENIFEERRFENRFQLAISDPRFKYGTRMRHEKDLDVKRFVVELYESLKKKRKT